MYKLNLVKGFLQLMHSLDCFLNAVSDGHYKATISGRVGRFELTKPHSRYWKTLGKVIDETFRPLQGGGHCYKEYLWEKRNGITHERGNDVALAVLGIGVIVFCLFVLAPIIYIMTAINGMLGKSR